jgi:hypothetical protein
MAIGSYPRVTVQGTGNANNPQNGQGLMIFNPSTQRFEAATAATFAGGGGGGGDATAANQTTQISVANTTNSILNSINSKTPATGNETSKSQTLTITPTTIGTASCKSVTIYMLSTAAAPAEVIINSAGGGTVVILEQGYSMLIEVTSLDRIEVYQTGGENDVIYIKYL